MKMIVGKHIAELWLVKVWIMKIVYHKLIKAMQGGEMPNVAFNFEANYLMYLSASIIIIIIK